MVMINARTRIVMVGGGIHVIDFHVEDTLALIEKAAKGAQMMGLGQSGIGLRQGRPDDGGTFGKVLAR
jgi:hypothetical protein